MSDIALERAMRINARLDETAQAQLDDLAQATGQIVSHVVSGSVARYCLEVRARQQGPRRMLAMMGTGHSGRTDIASNVERELDDLLAAKHGNRGI